MGEDLLNSDIADLAKSRTELWQELKDTTILITGASGFIGSHIVRLLTKLNNLYDLDIKIVAIVRDKSRFTRRFSGHGESDIRFIVQNDATDPIKIGFEVDYCIHLASKANPTAYVQDPVGTLTTNVIGTNNILSSLLKNKSLKNIVYASSIEAYGRHDHIDAISEEIFGAIDSKQIRSCYPISKSCAENLCFSYGEQYNLPVCVARLAYIYGPGDNIDDPKVVTSFMRDVRNGNNIVLKSDGLQERTYCYINDAVVGIFLLLLRGSSGKAYNISSLNNTTTIKNIAEQIIKLFGNGNQRVETITASDSDRKQFSLNQNNILDNSRIKDLGYAETTDLENGLINTGKYFGLELGSTR